MIVGYFAATFTSRNLAGYQILVLLWKPYTQNKRKFNFPPRPYSLRLIVILSKHVLSCFRVLPSQLVGVIRSETLLCGVPTRNSAHIPSSIQNRNSTRVGAPVTSCWCTMSNAQSFHKRMRKNMNGICLSQKYILQWHVDDFHKDSFYKQPWSSGAKFMVLLSH